MVCFLLQFTVCCEGKSREESEAETEIEAVSLLLITNSQIAHLLSYTTQGHLTKCARDGLNPPTLTISQENSPRTCLQADLMEEFSPLRLSFQMTLGCV